MKPPVDHVRVSSRGKEILVRIKRHTGLQHWNEICRVALCRSLANPTPPQKTEKVADSSIEMEWKTFAGPFQQELAATFFLRAIKDNIELSRKDVVGEYFKSHLERGIMSMHNTRGISMILGNKE